MCLRRARAGLLCLSSVQRRVESRDGTPRGVPSPGRGGLAWPRRAGPNVESAFGILDFARIDHRGHAILLHDEHDPGLHVTCTCIRCRAANRGAPLVCAPPPLALQVCHVTRGDRRAAGPHESPFARTDTQSHSCARVCGPSSHTPCAPHVYPTCATHGDPRALASRLRAQTQSSAARPIGRHP